jgi:DEAD/DEAH box helicase domain-containing protein
MAPSDHADVDEIVAHLRADPRLVHVERLERRPARFAELSRPLPPAVRGRLPISAFWSHQAEAIDLAREGRSVAVATGTASGKSLCYQVPIAEAVAEGLRPATALLLFPTKALAQDQLRALTAMEVPRLVAATYDGDCGPEERTWVRAHANVLLTNPEMLHHGILPNHARWATFLMRLRYVVVDELHVLRGIFGSHVAHLLRRLRRLCATYGADPTFVFSSATIGRPEVLAAALCGRPVAAVTNDGSPRGERLFVLWNPARGPDGAVRPTTTEPPGTPDGTTGSPGPADGRTARPPAVAAERGDVAPDAPLEEEHADALSGGPPDSLALLDIDLDGLALDGTPPSPRRLSANKETAALVAELVRRGRRTIAFCRSRKGTEVVAADIDRRLPAELRNRVRPYRAGYLTDERRAIEAELFSGELRGIVATTALELGVDIGSLDACVLNGFPGTIASMWQQAGRAGRQTQQSLAVLVAGDDQLDQWLMAHPTEVFTRAPEPAVINVANPFVLLPHLACAAYEQPLSHADERWWPELLDDAVRDLVVTDRLRIRQRGRRSLREPIAVWSGAGGWPAHRVALRGGGGGEVRILREDGTLVGTTDGARASRLVHPGAVYLHRGEAYRVTELDLESGDAVVARTDGATYTQPRSETEITILGTEARRPVAASTLAIGWVRVRSRVVGYRVLDTYTGKLVAVEPLHLPPSELVTRAFWYVIPPAVLEEAGVAARDWPGALHAIEHAAIGMMPLFTICDRWDVGGVSTPLQEDTGGPTIVVYDAHAGGSGVAELGYDAGDRHLRATLDVISSCPCEQGCPSCVQSPKCGNGNEPLDKAAAVAVLRQLLGS